MGPQFQRDPTWETPTPLDTVLPTTIGIESTITLNCQLPKRLGEGLFLSITEKIGLFGYKSLSCIYSCHIHERGTVTRCNQNLRVHCGKSLKNIPRKNTGAFHGTKSSTNGGFSIATLNEGTFFCIAGHQSSHHSGSKNCHSETSETIHNGLNESKSSSQRLPYFGAKDSVHAGIPYGVAQISSFPSLNPPEKTGETHPTLGGSSILGTGW